MKKEEYELLIESIQIGNRAVHKAQDENKKLGIPNVYATSSTIFFEMPDGSITTKRHAELSLT